MEGSPFNRSDRTVRTPPSTPGSDRPQSSSQRDVAPEVVSTPEIQSWMSSIEQCLNELREAVAAGARLRQHSAVARRAAGSTGDKTESARQQGPAPRASARASLPPRRRWVPPSALRHHEVPVSDAKHDVIFRKVRGILNKLTPEKFQKLSDDLLALELDSDTVLKGVILLIFEKALDEPKYSSMYAQLCKRLSEEAPNLEPAGQPCTFKLLLLNKCRTEFENRAQAFAAYEERALAPEEEEKRHLAKCKMLGNIKFIGELGKLEILAESILHRCIQNLLARRAAAEHHEDLECLAQLVRTCGRVLDSERGRGLMDQYFARIETLSGARDLAPRIRFMLRDVVELRRGGWTPRAAVSHEGPVPIHQLREDDEPPRGREREREREREPLFRRARPLDDVLAGLSLAPAAALHAPPDKLFGNGFAGRDYRQRAAPAYHRPAAGHRPAAKEPPAARSKRVLAAGGALHDVQMRPAANSLMFTANRLSRAQPAPQLQPAAPPSALAPAFASAAPLLKEPAIAIKPAPDKKDKPKKDKTLSKEEACRLALAAVDAVAAAGGEGAEGAEGAEEGAPAAEPLRRLIELQLPDKVLRRCIAGVLERALEAEGEAAVAAACAVVRGVRRAPGAAADAARALLARHPHAGLARVLAHLVRARLLPLHDAAAWCDAPARSALLLDLLQHLLRLLGLERVQDMLADSKVNVCAFVAGAEEGEGAGAGAGVAAEAALAALEARGLGALAPQLRVQAALARQLAAEPAPHALYRWIKAHVEPAVRGAPPFVSALVGLLAAHVSRAAGSAAPGADKAAVDREKELLEAYAPLLTALLAARPDLQLAAVYAAQLHAHHHRYPKGMLLRWFLYLYNLEICEEDAFLRWREDVTDAYPGKGEALFQVNAWLTWLQQQESEEEEGED